MSGAFVLAAGGTGGHLFPAEAVARELAASGAQVRLLTDSRTHALAAAIPGIEIHFIRAGRLTGGPVRAARGLAELAVGALQARRLLKRMQPAAVIGFGGYTSLPVMLASVSLGLPSLIHEQNAVLGRANRLLAPLVGAIAAGFPETAKLRPADRMRTIHIGNPVRPAILAVADCAYAPPGPDGTVELLVIGGSQGAHIFAEIVPAALAMTVPAQRRRLRISQQARPEDRAAVIDAYAEAGISAEVESFFEDVPQRLARAHLVICRAGASTLAELAAVGRPAVLVPYPHAADDHQTANADAFAAAGGGIVIAQTDLRAARLAADLERLIADGAALSAMAWRTAQFSRRDAARQLALQALGLASATPQECAA